MDPNRISPEAKKKTFELLTSIRSLGSYPAEIQARLKDASLNVELPRNLLTIRNIYSRRGGTPNEVREYIQALSASDPANPFLNLLKRQPSISYDELVKALSEFAFSAYYQNLGKEVEESALENTDQEQPVEVRPPAVDQNTPPEKPEADVPQKNAEPGIPSLPQIPSVSLRTNLVRKPPEPLITERGQRALQRGVQAEGRNRRIENARQFREQTKNLRTKPLQTEAPLRPPSEVSRNLPERRSRQDNIRQLRNQRLDRARNFRTQIQRTRVVPTARAPVSSLQRAMSARTSGVMRAAAPGLGRVGIGVQNLTRVAGPRAITGFFSGLGRGALGFLGMGGTAGSSGLIGRGGLNFSGAGGIGRFAGGGGIGRGVGAVAQTAAKIPPWIWLLLLMLLLFLFLFFNAQQECGKEGTVELQKSGPAEVENGKQIDYQILVNFKGSCVADVTVTDQVPANTKFVKADSSYKILGGFDTMNVGGEGVLQGNQVRWLLKGMTTGQTATLTLSVEPTVEDVWVVNQASYNARFQTDGTTRSGGFPSGPSRGLLCVDNLDSRLVRIFEEAGVKSNTSPSLLFAIAKAENGGDVKPWSLDGKLHPISPCGAHGLMQIQHPNDGSGKNYAASCAAIGGSSNPPEVFDGLKARYNEASEGNINDADADNDSIYGSGFYVKERSQPAGKGSEDQLTEAELRRISKDYLGAVNGPYADQYVNTYNNAFAAQRSCGGSTQP